MPKTFKGLTNTLGLNEALNKNWGALTARVTTCLNNPVAKLIPLAGAELYILRLQDTDMRLMVWGLGTSNCSL